jgi:hypothetical protein
MRRSVLHSDVDSRPSAEELCGGKIEQPRRLAMIAAEIAGDGQTRR